MTGETIGRLEVQRRWIEVRSGRRVVLYECLCQCGKVTVASHSNLRNGNTKSCGCLRSESLASRLRKPLEDVLVNQIRNYYKRNAAQRGLSWEVTDQELQGLIFEPCHYCGVLGASETKRHYKTSSPAGNSLRNNGIDRVDNRVGYVISNLVPCCKYCNIAKMSMSREEFLAWVARVYNHSVEKRLK